MPGTRVRPLAGPSTSLVPGLPLRRALRAPYRNGRDKPGHDGLNYEFPFSAAATNFSATPFMQ
jgi:hypothetical protein